MIAILLAGLSACCDDPAARPGTGKSTCALCPNGQPTAAERLQACQAAEANADAGAKCPGAGCKITKTKHTACTYTTAPNAPGSDQWEVTATTTGTYTCN